MGISEKEDKEKKQVWRSALGVRVLLVQAQPDQILLTKTHPGLEPETQSEKLSSPYQGGQNIYCRVFLLHDVRGIYRRQNHLTTW